MRVLRAESLGMCFGVRDAMALALADPRRGELTILGELVHNPEVLRRLAAAGIRSAPGLDASVSTPRVMITAHGAAHREVARLRERGLEVVEATCPLVAFAHRSLQRLAAEGFFSVVIGRRDHVEVRGLVGDLDEYAVLESAADLPLLAGRARLGVASQTTQPLDAVLELVAQIRAAYPQAEVRFVDTVCQPTKERQAAARRLGAQCQVVVVVGGRNSNNTRQLVRTCAAAGARVYQVEDAAGLHPEWLEGVETVGLTAGTSTPDDTIAAVEAALLDLEAPRRAAA